MGSIKPDVEALHLRSFPNEKPILKPFLFNFDVSHGRRFNVLGTQFSAYILSPDDMMKNGFAFQDELLLILHSYSSIQARTIQAVERVFSSQRFEGRVDPLTYFLVSQDPNIEEWSNNYLMAHPQARTPIPLSFDAISANKDDRWFIRNQLSSKLYKRDLFDYQLPLDEDLLFFGRKHQADDLIDAVRKGQNRGLFGLRKTGKTSLLFKVQRDIADLSLARTVYIDCKRPDIRSLPWDGLIEYIAERVADLTGKRVVATKEPIKNLIRLLSTLEGNDRVCLIFDEIEYISPLARINTHWHADFVPFWQTLWSLQSEYRRFSFVVAGVNPYLCEVDLIDRTQNPMFGIVRPSYLTGLSLDEVTQMVKAIGGRMGLAFEPEAISYLFFRYGGHPLLTRMACSYTNQMVIQQGQARPLPITRQRLATEENDREEELYFYCRHIISELQEFYPDEHDMLELLSAGNIVDFNDLAGEPGWIKHLKSYGLIEIAASGRPSFRIPVVQRFVALERARRTKSREVRAVIAADKRPSWIESRKRNIIRDMKALIRNMAAKGLWQPYGVSFLPEADLLGGIELATNWATFNSFITELNKCLVETIDLAHSKADFFKRLRSEYSDLFEALLRIRLLRNNADHLRLNAQVEDGLKTYLQRDLFGRSLSQIGEPWFVLQQIVLDELFAAIQYEGAKIA